MREYGAELRCRYRLAATVLKVMWHIVTCRTAALGGHLDVCDACGYERVSYNSCRDRHCPKCQALPAARWIEQRRERVIPTHYFHLVFTVPGELYEIFQDNKTQLYGLFFSAVNETLAKFASDPRLLGGTPAYFSVLHTTNRRLGYHPHLHVVIAGAGWDRTKKRLVKVRCQRAA